jgi:transposase
MVLVDGQGVPLGVHHVDGRKQRCYRRRWKIERTNAWLLSFRRLTVRYDHKLEHYRAFVYLACALITLQRFFLKPLLGK